MSDQKKARNSIIVQGSVLVVTAFVTRIIGLLYRFPLTQIIGKTGNDYYSTAYSIYSILLIISSYSLPTAVSKMISEREAKGEYENARRIFKGSMIFAIIAGGLSSVILFFG
ncbi:MAG: oligosaccharide flippase family protein, partial [Lachnospiraceae bacterium]|nr:oligosaccharide flippase family protein [Lachnospiraceae bacterium]